MKTLEQQLEAISAILDDCIEKIEAINQTLKTQLL